MFVLLLGSFIDGYIFPRFAKSSKWPEADMWVFLFYFAKYIVYLYSAISYTTAAIFSLCSRIMPLFFFCHFCRSVVRWLPWFSVAL